MRKLFASVVVLAVLLTSLMSCVELPFISSDNESESAETVTETEQDTAQETESKKNDGTTEKETAKAPDPSP